MKAVDKNETFTELLILCKVVALPAPSCCSDIRYHQVTHFNQHSCQQFNFQMPDMSQRGGDKGRRPEDQNQSRR